MKYLEKFQNYITEARVPRTERIELYRDDNIVVVVPLTYDSLMKYATNCSWCINGDLEEWEEYFEGETVLIVQRKSTNNEIGITKKPKNEEFFWLSKLLDETSDWEDVLDFLELGELPFRNVEEVGSYVETLKKNINSFNTNVVLCSGTSIYDAGNNEISEFTSLKDIPNITDDAISNINKFLSEIKLSTEK